MGDCVVRKSVKESYVPRLPCPGETLHGDQFSVGFGGKGANQCIAAARLGAKTAMVAKLGDDVFGRNYLENFKQNSVNTDHVTFTSEASTGVAPIAVAKNGENSIVIVSGANLLLTIEDICASQSLLSSAKVIICQLEIKPEVSLSALKLARQHQGKDTIMRIFGACTMLSSDDIFAAKLLFSGAKVILCELTVGMDITLATLKQARHLKVKTILNAAPITENFDSELYAYCDVLCVNEHEAHQLTGQHVRTVDDARRAVLTLLERGCATVIVTLGSNGSVFATRSDTGSPETFHVPVEQVTAVDTTGAGDAFVGALAFYFAYLSTLSLTEIVRRSSQIATKSVQQRGTQTSYPHREELPLELFYDDPLHH